MTSLSEKIYSALNSTYTVSETDFPHHVGLPEENSSKLNDKPFPELYPNVYVKPSPTSHNTSILPSILDYVGNTPMVNLSRFAEHFGFECELVAKCEYLNPGGSIKDRIGKSMVEDALAKDVIHEGDILIEPTSGNAGIGIALAAIVNKMNMLITLPEKMSKEKVNVMKLMGCEIVRTPTEAAWNSPESHIGLAIKLNKMLEHSYILDQYSNMANPMVHYKNTAGEILSQCGNELDVVVSSAGTGGTVTGLGRRIKDCKPTCKVVGVDPVGSILAEPDTLNEKNRNQPYLVEGIGYDFVPTVLDRSCIDEWIKVEDHEAFHYARLAIKLEGLLVGGSSGSALAAAVKVCKTLKKGQRCCVVLPDSSRNYMSKFLDDDWMIEHGFIDLDDKNINLLADKTVSHLNLHTPITVMSNLMVADVVSLMYDMGIDQIPVVNKSGAIQGVVTEGNLSSYLHTGRLGSNDPVEKGMYKSFKKVTMSCSLLEVSKMLYGNAFIIVVSEQNCYENVDNFTPKQIVVGVITRIDLLRYVTKLTGSAHTKSTPNNI